MTKFTFPNEFSSVSFVSALSNHFTGVTPITVGTTVTVTGFSTLLEVDQVVSLAGLRSGQNTVKFI